MMEFEVEHTTGDICISGTLDFETRTSYEFPVIATDQGNFEIKKKLYWIAAETPRFDHANEMIIRMRACD